MTKDIWFQYESFIEDLSLQKKIYYLQLNDDVLVVKDEDNDECIPFWSKKDLLDFCLENDWKEYSFVEIESAEFIESWLSQLLEDKITVLVNYDLKTVITATPNEIQEDLARRES